MARLLWHFLHILLIGLMVGNAWADSPEPAGYVSHLTGTLSAEHADGTHILMSVKSSVYAGDLLSTADNSYARIKFLDDSELVLSPNSRVKITEYHFVPADPPNDRSFIELIKGGLRRVTGLIGKRNRSKDTVQTPVAAMGIRGTHYGLLMCQQDCGGIPTLSGLPLKDGLHIDVKEGEVSVSNKAGERAVTAGQFAYVQDWFTMPVIVPISQGVQVTAPAAIIKNKGQGQTLDVTNCNGQCVVQ